MKNLLSIFCLATSIIFLAGCKDKVANNAVESDCIKITPLESYFSLIKPSEPTFLVLKDSTFYEYFNPAAVMNKLPLSINFSKQQVGAIIYPETAFDFNISIDSVCAVNKEMSVYYSIEEGKDEQSYTIVPVYLFAFDASIGVDSVLFINKGKQNLAKFY